MFLSKNKFGTEINRRQCSVLILENIFQEQKKIDPIGSRISQFGPNTLLGWPVLMVSVQQSRIFTSSSPK
jgi:hypothetical protein